MNLESLCQKIVDLGASDLILHEFMPPVARVRGSLLLAGEEAAGPEIFDELWACCGASEEAFDFDAALSIGDGHRFRVNLMRSLGSRGAVLRHIRREIPSLEQLGLPREILEQWLRRRSGIILITGPTGSGKTTTLAACLETINQTESRHIVTIEEPVEYVFTNHRSLFTQRDVGVDTPTFANGLRQALRLAPDVILIGEIRDPISAVTAIQAAETGHLILATVHGARTPEAIDRIAQLLPVDERALLGRIFASQLIGVLSQRLLPGEGGAYVLATEYFTNAGAPRRYIEEGRVGELRDFIERGDGSSAQSLMRSIVGLCKAGVLSEEAGLGAVDNPSEFTRAMRGISNRPTRT